MIPSNIYAATPELASGESFQELLRSQNVVVERIVSSSQVTPTEYNQEQDEWVLLLQGEATLELDGAEHQLGSGDYLFIPAHTPHRVLSTSADPQCIWLAVHIHPQPK